MCLHAVRRRARTRGGDAKNPTSVRPETGFSISVWLEPDQAVSPSARTDACHHHQLVARVLGVGFVAGILIRGNG
jgi:hypothetical protein